MKSESLVFQAINELVDLSISVLEYKHSIFSLFF